MKLKRGIKFFSPRSALGNERGFILVVALVLLVTLTLVGTTARIMTSTDIKIGGNYSKSQKALQVAMAGVEHGREVLRALNASSLDTKTFSDELAAKVGSNAMLEGYDSDDDPLVNPTSLGGSNYVVYLTNDLVDGATNQADSNARVLITSVGEGPANAFAKVEIEVIRGGGLTTPSPLYAKEDVTGNGSSLSIDGNDDCATPAPALPPVYTKSPAETDLNGNPTINGNPPSAVEGPIDLDIISYIQTLKAGATVVTTDQNGTNFGDSTNYVSLYSDTSDPYNVQGLKIRNGIGYGILLVDGDLSLGGGFAWNGLILVSGTLTFNGGGGGINIRGAVLANQTVDINGNIDIRYDSCKVDKSLASAGLTVVSWKHDY